MADSSLDALARFLAGARSRRELIHGLRILVVGGVLQMLDAQDTAAKHHKKHKQPCARAGQPTSKKHKHCCSGLSLDGSGRCVAPTSSPPPCVPGSCPGNACGSLPDGCGGTLVCGCATDQLCHDGACQACTVTCHGGNPVTCAHDLQVALTAGGTVYVCPGRYQPSAADGFFLNTAVTVIGAGQGAGVGTDTILDAQAGGRVMHIPSGTGPVVLQRLRLTGGTIADDGAGIQHQGTTLQMTDCTVAENTTTAFNGLGGGLAVGSLSTLEMTRCAVRDNHATGQFGTGGGIWTGGPTTLTDCLIEANGSDNGAAGIFLFAGTTTLAGTTTVQGNQAGSYGGGLFVNPGATLNIAETCRITRNTAAPGHGGGIFNNGGTVTLEGADPSPIVVDNCQENCAGNPVPKCSPAPPTSSCP